MRSLVRMMLYLASAMAGMCQKNPNGGLALLRFLVQLANILTTWQICAGFQV